MSSTSEPIGLAADTDPAVAKKWQDAKVIALVAIAIVMIVVNVFAHRAYNKPYDPVEDPEFMAQVAARRQIMSAASSSAHARAIGNCTPWLEPIGRSNTTRSRP